MSLEAFRCMTSSHKAGQKDLFAVQMERQTFSWSFGRCQEQ